MTKREEIEVERSLVEEREETRSTTRSIQRETGETIRMTSSPRVSRMLRSPSVTGSESVLRSSIFAWRPKREISGGVGNGMIFFFLFFYHLASSWELGSSGAINGELASNHLTDIRL